MTFYDSARAFARRYSTRPDTRTSGTWALLCALLMARFALAPGGVGWAVAPRGYGNANVVDEDSGPLNRNAAAAPIGAFHFWDWGVDDHVGTDLTGGGRDVFMASSFLRESWGQHIGVNSVAGYNAANTAAKYKGWSTNYRGGRYNLPAGTASTGTPSPLTSEENDMPIVVRRQASGVTYTVGFGFIRYHQDDRDRGLALYSTHGGVINEADVIQFNDPDFQTMLLDWGMPEIAWSPGFGSLPGPGNGFYSAPWRGPAGVDGGPASYPTPAAPSLTDAQLGSIATKVVAGIKIPTAADVAVELGKRISNG